MFFHGGEGKNSDGGAAASVDAVVVDGLAVLGAVADFEGDGFGRAGDGWGESGVNFGFAEVFAEHLGLRFDVLWESDAGAEGFLHRADVTGEGVLYILLNAKTFLDLPTAGNFVKGPTADGESGWLADACRGYRARYWRSRSRGDRTLGGSILDCGGWRRRFRYLVSALRRRRWSRRGNDGWLNRSGGRTRDFSWGGGGRLGNGWRARGGGQLIVRHDANHKYRLAGFDFVAGGEHGLLNFCAIKMGAVGASFVDDAAAVRTALDGEVNTGHVIVVGNSELSAVRRTADTDGFAIRKRNFLTREGTGLDFEEHSHVLPLRFLPSACRLIAF